MERSCILILLTSLLALSNCDTRCYDHQPVDYHSKFEPAGCNKKCTVTPFFSPDHSVDAYLDLINSATESLDIFTPGFDSWIKCTHYSSECDNDCIGCSLQDQQNETFPIFPALLNAVNQRGIQVRMLTNNYSQPTCFGKIAPLDWLYLNKIQIRFYTTTTFMHSKFVMVDKGKRTSVSSVNFSKTSFTKNREAGVILEGCDCSVTDLYKEVFEYDWDKGTEYKMNQHYSSSDMEVITSQGIYNESFVPPAPISGAYVTPMKTFRDVKVTRGSTSPDNALTTMKTDLGNVKSSLQLAIYQITDMGLCNQTLALYQSGVEVSIIVSARIVSYGDYKKAQECYQMLYDGGMKGSIRKALTKFMFAHQKYWIIDNNKVHLSTGNWSPSDFPEGSSFSSYHQTGQSVNRDLLVVMEDESVVDLFQTVFQNDWQSGTDWAPKRH